MEQIIEKNKIELPEGMIRFEVEQDQRYFENQIKQAGSTLEGYLAMVNQTQDQYTEQLKETAIKRIQSQLILEAITKQEKIEASDDDVIAEIKRLRPEIDSDEKAQEELKKLNADGLKKMVAQQKTFDFLIGSAKITEKKK